MDKKHIKDLSEYLNISEEETEQSLRKISERLSTTLNNPSFYVELADKTLENFHQDIRDANSKFGSEREKFISSKKNFLYLLLNRQLTSNQLALNLIENKKEQIKEQHDYWEKELTRLPDTNKRIRELDIEFKKEEIKKILKSVRRSLKFLLAHNLATRLKDIKEEFLSAVYMFQNIKEEVSSNSAIEIKKDIISTSKELEEKTTADDAKLINDILADNNLIDQEKEDNASDNELRCRVKYDANYFNKISYYFFTYLIDNYIGGERIDRNAKGVKQELSYIWHFMKDCNYYEEDFSFTMTGNKFKEIIWKHYDIELKNMNKKDSYFNKHHSLINQHFRDYKKK